jgi:hypothetical protein
MKHITIGVQMDQKTYSRHDEQHNCAQWIQQKGELKIKTPDRYPIEYFIIKPQLKKN